MMAIFEHLDHRINAKSHQPQDFLSFFFCVAGDHGLISATDVLRGLIYILLDQRESLIKYLEKEYRKAGY